MSAIKCTIDAAFGSTIASTVGSAFCRTIETAVDTTDVPAYLQTIKSAKCESECAAIVIAIFTTIGATKYAALFCAIESADWST